MVILLETLFYVINDYLNLITNSAYESSQKNCRQEGYKAQWQGRVTDLDHVQLK